MSLRLLRGAIPALACLPVLAAPPPDEPPEAAAAPQPARKDPWPSRLPEGAVAVVGGRPVSLDDYQRYLFATVGIALLPGYVDQLLIQEEAKRLGVSIPYETVEREAKKQVEEEMRLFKSREEYLAALEGRGYSQEEKLRQVRQRTIEQLALDECIRRTRSFSEEEVARKMRDLGGNEPPAGPALERAREEALRALRDRPPTAEERRAYREGLRRKAEVRIAVPSPAPGPPPEAAAPAPAPPAAPEPEQR